MSEEPEDFEPKLNLNIIYEGKQLTVEVKQDMLFRMIFRTAEQRFGEEFGSLKFTYEGRWLLPTDAVADWSIEDGDRIDAFLEEVDS